mmetsp:Transcript_60158/g.105372  ORF Transcript_60158/g.105372 Transcript_60158/m.105372 type:complete len:327 (-) Transcript_60158:132-1112(-)
MRNRRSLSSRSQRHVGNGPCECPNWWLHWSQPEKDGRTPSFCSVCGSRSQSRRRLDGAAVSLRHQVELLREIARQQSEDITDRRLEVKWLTECLERRHSSAALAAAEKRDQSELEASLAAARADVERLHCELHVWRGEGVAWDHTLTGHGSAEALRQEEARHAADHGQWQTERAVLLAQLADVREQIRRLERSSAVQAGSAIVDFPGWQAEMSKLHDDIAAERRAAGLARERLDAMRQEVEDSRRAQASQTAQGERELNTTLEELNLTERRIEVEGELQRAQQAQLRSVESTLGSLGAQLQRARLENSDLRASLEHNQEMLRHLRR